MTKEEISSALADLSSRSVLVLAGCLKRLNSKLQQAPNPELAEVLRPHIHHVDDGIRGEAERALARFDPEYAQLYPLLAAYRKGGEVEETPFSISTQLEIPLGLIVLCRERSSWFPAKVIGETEKGAVELRQVRWPHREHSASRIDLRLADRRAEQPYVSEAVLSQIYGGSAERLRPRITERTWTDESGSFQLEGTFVSLDDSIVHLTLNNGKRAKVPLEKLSGGDQKYVESLMQERQKENPFEIEE